MRTPTPGRGRTAFFRAAGLILAATALAVAVALQFGGAITRADLRIPFLVVELVLAVALPVIVAVRPAMPLGMVTALFLLAAGGGGVVLGGGIAPLWADVAVIGQIVVGIVAAVVATILRAESVQGRSRNRM